LLFFFHAVHKMPGVDDGNDLTCFPEWCSRRALIKRQVQCETDIGDAYTQVANRNAPLSRGRLTAPGLRRPAVENFVRY
jgi:hypothetical protein